MSGNRLQGKLNRLRGAVVGDRSTLRGQDAPVRYHQMAEAVGGRVVSGGAGCFCMIKTHYSRHHSHGDLVLGDIPGDGVFPVSAFTRDDEPGDIEPASLLFIDIETTGLGGAGAVAFLVGCGSVVEEGFEVRQYVIPDYSDEAAMLEVLSSEFDETRVIATYNGAAFDLPLLRDRMIINRVARELAMDRHLDLLHPVRRLFRRRLGDCRLINVEKELFGFRRNDDIPGHLIPSVYFDWLARQDPELLGTILEHNRLDIISLYYLAAYLARAFRTEGGMLEMVDDLYSLSRIYCQRRQYRRAVGLYYRIDALQNQPPAVDVLLFHAQAFKRAGVYEKAVALWEQLSSAISKEGFWANIELAKYYEHRIKDIETAYRHAQKAGNATSLSQRQQRLLDKRLLRLQSKMSR